jgi:hypothetical protein
MAPVTTTAQQGFTHPYFLQETKIDPDCFDHRRLTRHWGGHRVAGSQLGYAVAVNYHNSPGG